MNNQATTIEQKRSFLFWMIVIMVIRITSYFMLSEAVILTQIFKVGFRFLVSGISFIMLYQLFQKDKALHFRYPYPLAIIFYVAYLLLGMFSLLWTSKMSDSMLQLLMDSECLVFCYLYMNLIGAYNSTHTNPLRISRILSVAISLILVFFIFGMYINPDKFYRLTHGGEVARLGGFIINPNELGMLIVIGFAMCCADLKHMNKKGWGVLMMILLIYSLVLTGSRSSMIGMFLILLFYIKKSQNLKLQLGVITCMILSVPFIVKEIFIKAGDTDEVMNLTGRIPFWHDLLTINFPKEPILGFGFMRIDYHDRFDSLNSYAGEMTHNTFIQVLMNLGLVGLFLVLMQLAFTIHAMTTDRDSDKKMVAIGLFIPTLINSFTEFGIFGETNYGIMFYLFIVFMYGMHVNKFRIPSYTGQSDGSIKKSTLFRSALTP